MKIQVEKLTEDYLQSKEVGVTQIHRLNLGRCFSGPFGTIFFFVNVFDRSQRPGSGSKP